MLVGRVQFGSVLRGLLELIFGRFSRLLNDILGSFWGFGRLLGAFGSQVRVMHLWGWLLDGFRAAPGPTRSSLGVVLGSSWSRLGGALSTSWAARRQFLGRRGAP